MSELERLAQCATGRATPDADALMALERHRVAALTAYWADAAGLALAPPVRRGLAAARREAAAREAIQRRELVRVAAALDRAGVIPLAIKGAAVAYDVYPDPSLRPRVDTDLFVDERELPSIATALAALGYRRDVEPPGALASYQLHFARDAAGFAHRLDVHWRLTNPQRFANVLTIDEVRRSSRAIDPPLRAPARPLSLLIACVHRAAHHFASDSLVWMFDIHAIASRVTVAEWPPLVALARTRDAGQVLADGVLRAARLFETELPPSVRADLEACVSQRGSRSGRFLDPRRRYVDVLQDDLRALPTWRARARLLREHVLPPAGYMRQRYGIRGRLTLPAWYAYRVIRGAPRWFTRGSADEEHTAEARKHDGQ